MTITASMVKELRESTGAGMMDAKKALTETDGDMEAAVDWLRTKGLAKAAKKSSRTAAEGLVGVAVEGGRGVVVEVNSETDFVAKNAEFQSLVRDVARAALNAEDLESLKQADMGGRTAEQAVTEAIAKIGENMTIRRMASITGETVVSYVHNAAGEGLGKIGVLVALSGTDSGIGRQIAMHVAAANPAALDEASMDQGVNQGARDPDRQGAGGERDLVQAQARRGHPQQHHPGPDEEVRGREHAAGPSLRREPRTRRSRGGARGRRGGVGLRPARRSARGSRRSRRTSRPRSRR
jgi:elongation factor Ts